MTDDAAARSELVALAGKDQAPCLVSGGKPLHESADIVRYLAAPAPTSPADPAGATGPGSLRRARGRPSIMTRTSGVARLGEAGTATWDGHPRCLLAPARRVAGG